MTAFIDNLKAHNLLIKEQNQKKIELNHHFNCPFADAL